MKYPEEEEGVEEEVILEEEEITGEGETQEVEEEGSAVEVEAGEIIEEGAAAVEVVEIEVNLAEAEVEEEASIEYVGEEGHPAEVAIEKGRGHPMEEETGMRAEDRLLHLRIAERETTIERKEEDLLQEMDHPEDHHLPGTAMVLLVETMGDPPLQGPPEDLMRVAGPAVEPDMKKATPVEVLLHLPGQTDTGAEALLLAGILHHMQGKCELPFFFKCPS